MTRLASFALLATTIWIVVKMAQVEGQLSFNARPWPSWPKEEDEDENPAVNKRYAIKMSSYNSLWPITHRHSDATTTREENEDNSLRRRLKFLRKFYTPKFYRKVQE